MLNGTRIIKVALFLLLALGSLALGRYVDWEDTLSPTHLADVLKALGPWGPPILIVSMATAVIIPPIPSLPLDLASGAAFGPLFGTLYAVIGAAIGATASFLIGRALGREGISRLLRADAVFCEKCSDRHIGLLIFLARLIPVFSFDVVSYGAGFTTISLRTFSLATIAGMIPPTFAFTYLGSAVVSARWLLIGAACALVAMVLLVPSWLKRHRSSTIAVLFFGPPGPQPLAPRSTPVPMACPACGAPLSPEARTLVLHERNASSVPPERHGRDLRGHTRITIPSPSALNLPGLPPSKGKC